jgi:hypothetical protein
VHISALTTVFISQLPLTRRMNHELFNKSRWFHALPSICYMYALSSTHANSCNSVSKMAPWLHHIRLSTIRQLDPALESALLNNEIFLISNFCHVLNAVCFLLGNSPASEIYMPTFRNTLFHLHRQVGVCRTFG